MEDEMNKKVFYYSKTGNTKKIAEKMAEGLGIIAEDISSAIACDADIVFIGAAVYATSNHLHDPKVYEFINELSKKKIGEVYVFDTYLMGSSINELRKYIENKGMNVSKEYYSCKGKFALFNVGRPNKVEIEKAVKFAKSKVI